MLRVRGALAFVLAAGAAMDATAQEAAPRRNAPDPKRVDEAIRKGVAYLKSKDPAEETQELYLWTYVHAGLGPDDSHLKSLLDGMLRRELRATYRVALQAMILEKLDRLKYQTRIFHCAQFLVDNQWESGQWGYGKPTVLPDPPAGVPSTDRRKVATTPQRKGVVEFDPRAVRTRLPVARQPHDPGSRGDNSNSQYALLGMRACHDAGILFPAETLARAEKWWRESQVTGDKKEADGRPAVATGGQGPFSPAGWTYSEGGDVDRRRSGSRTMTVGGLGSLCILDSIQGKDWKRDPDVLEAVNWVAANFIVEDPGPNAANKNWHFYYLYGLERAGILFGSEFFGPHEWYPLGARWLLDQQRADGSWGGNGRTDGPIDTCFAILFLRRATRELPPVASTDRHASSRR